MIIIDKESIYKLLPSNKKDLAAVKTKEAEEKLSRIKNILKESIKTVPTIIWEDLLDKSEYSKRKPLSPKPLKLPKEPHEIDPSFKPKVGTLFGILFPEEKQKEIEEMKNNFQKAHLEWERACSSITEKNSKMLTQYDDDVLKWEKEGEDFFKNREEKNQEIIKRKGDYFNKQKDAIVDYCEMFLSKCQSFYPETFPQEFQIDFNPESGILLIDYFLPSKENIPTLKEVKYNDTRAEFKESHISGSSFNELYDDLLYQLTLLTIYQLYKNDSMGTITSVIFNGYVRFIDKGTGKEAVACILSVQAVRDDFLAINLENVDPKTCFKKLKGIGSSKLHGLAAIAPIMQINREDKRFVSPYAVVDNVDEKSNIAAMDWQDFENLIREIFEKEFAASGGEVKITRASRDEGVDAVAFDPDPVRGGKIVIQAKRYTNIVGVSAVRDLYGTVMNEGAMKGILVTTTDYGPDAYKFAQDKPLTLLNGNNLLHLLEKHGHKAKIDVKEARKTLDLKDKDENKNY
ncbi:MAG: restriction endonuclease [Candidatus Omnitrophota bacterium]